jgi:hypothetical protein
MILIKIAIIIPSTSRQRNWSLPQDSYLYETIQSVKDTYAAQHCTDDNTVYEYKFFIGIDTSDTFYNDTGTIKFYKEHAVNIEFIKMDVEPGHVTKIWNILAKHVYDVGYDYLYACGDDITFYKKGWIDACVDILIHHQNIGVTGPSSIENPTLLTQCFVHRTHFNIFGFFYPDEIKNWYCDDWMNLIYGVHKMPESYTCANKGGCPRYDIVQCPDLPQIVERDKLVIAQYLKQC